MDDDGYAVRDQGCSLGQRHGPEHRSAVAQTGHLGVDGSIPPGGYPDPADSPQSEPRWGLAVSGSAVRASEHYSLGKPKERRTSRCE